ncbi:PH domain-containing protein [Longispora sp. K20-0274]|uniref:PH domain-containing protein n=1 Tax=Longispora sp. K20-0274 TaxID=3088255 RepID=UPI00399A58B8
MDRTPPAPAPEVVARPWFLRLASRVVASGTTGVAVLAAIGWDDDGQPVLSWPRLGWSMLGMAVALTVGYLGSRPRVQVDPAGVLVVNLIGGRHVPWSAVRAVRLDGTRCARLQTVGGAELRLDAVRRIDREYATDAVTRLRDLLAASRARGS